MGTCVAGRGAIGRVLMIPTFILHMWLTGLLALGILGGGAYLGHEWWQRSWGWDATLQRSVFMPVYGWNAETGMLAGAVALLGIALFGGVLVKVVLRLFMKAKGAGPAGASAGSGANGDQGRRMDPRRAPAPDVVKRLERPDGSVLHVEMYGPEDGIPVVMTHGWGLHSHEWNYLKRELAVKHRLIVWDEPGMGKSPRSKNGDYSLENMASHLEAVLGMAVPNGKPAVLLGHSIGGMTVLTFCRTCASKLGSRVSGLILTHTTPLNPVRTTGGAAFYTAIEKPVLRPLMYLTIALSPLVWLMQWMSYRNGSAHLSAKRQSFAGTETWEELDFAARFQPHASPAVLARGMLGMMDYDARQVLGSILVPVLVVCGDKDTVTKPVASEMIRAGIAKAKLVTLSPAKHLGLVEHHESYARMVADFTERVTLNAEAAAAATPTAAVMTGTPEVGSAAVPTVVEEAVAVPRV